MYLSVTQPELGDMPLYSTSEFPRQKVLNYFNNRFPFVLRHNTKLQHVLKFYFCQLAPRTEVKRRKTHSIVKSSTMYKFEWNHN